MNLANRLTVLRIPLVPVFVAFLLYFTPERDYCRVWAISVYALACLTDALDGFLARQMGQKTELGSYMDPMADKLLLISGYLSLSLMHNLPEAMHIPGWLTLLVLSRDIVILTGALIIFIATGELKAQPLFVGKLTTVAQMAALFVSLLALDWNVRVCFYLFAAALIIISGSLYIRVGGRMMQEAS